jgi:hypothetical protein
MEPAAGAFQVAVFLAAEPAETLAVPAAPGSPVSVWSWTPTVAMAV